ncbi:MAG: hypothetical protein GEV10_23660 [Streptosporangiales bacterium]|nr:hypothetical protein [Streptosporangiales bacterium]
MTRVAADGSGYAGTAIDPSGIPLFDGDLVAVDAGARKFRTAAGECKVAGTQVHSRFQGLEGCYHAPERWELLSSTAQVRSGGLSFGGDLEQVGDALADYVQEMRPVAENLQSLFLQAVRFRSSIEDEGEDWDRDKDAVGQNNDLIRQVNTQVELKAAIERRCANRIEGLFGGRQWHAADEPGKPENAYGFDDIPDDADTPWGTAAGWEAPWECGVLGAYVSFYKGILVDGLGGTLLGLNQLTFNNTYTAALMALTGHGTWGQVGREAKNTGLAWAGLGKGVAGIALWTNPIVTPFVGASHALGVTPGWVKACERSALDMGKGIIAWDTWKHDPARAAGATVFNVGTFFLPGGEAGTVAKLVKGAHGAGEAGLVGKLAGHLDDGPPALLDEIPGVHPGTPGSLLPDGVATGGKLPAVDDLARTAGRDAHPRLPDLDDPIAARIDDPPPARTDHGGHDSSTVTRLPDDAPTRPHDSAADHGTSGHGTGGDSGALRLPPQPHGVKHLATTVPGGTEKALHAGSVPPEIARAIVRHEYPAVEGVNATRYEARWDGHNMNCTRCVLATDSTLGGSPASAMPVKGQNGASLYDVSGGSRHGWKGVSSYDDIVRMMNQAGPGSRGIVAINRGPGTVGHVFNVIYDRNGVMFIDGQIGTLATLESFHTLGFLPTT